VATQITATTPRTRPAPRLGVLGVAILAVIAVAVIGVGVWSQTGSIRDVTIDSQANGVGYPLHGGSNMGQYTVDNMGGTLAAGAAAEAVSNMGQYDVDNMGGTPAAGAAVSNMGQYDVENMGGTRVE
jgi:hypothetical protein